MKRIAFALLALAVLAVAGCPKPPPTETKTPGTPATERCGIDCS